MGQRLLRAIGKCTAMWISAVLLTGCPSGDGGGGGGGGDAGTGFAVQTTSAAFGVIGNNYDFTLSATGGTPPLTWSLAPGQTLPGNLTLNSATGQLTASPLSASPGSFQVTFQVTDAQARTATGQVTIIVYNRTVRVSVSSSGTAGNGNSTEPAITTTNGRFIAFMSLATNLGASGQQIYVHDRNTNAPALISRATGTAGAAGDGASSSPAISADGRFVAFTSLSSNLVPGVSGQQIYIRDTQLNTTTLVSRADGVAGATGNGASSSPAISADGRFVAFTSLSSNLVPGVSGQQVYLRDTQLNTTTLVSRATGAGGAVGNGASGAPTMSRADGRFVAFTSQATNLTADLVGGLSQIFIRDTVANVTTLASRATGAAGAVGNGASSAPSMSSDGRFVAFTSSSSNLTADPAPGPSQIFIRDTQTNTATLASRATGAAGAVGNGASSNPTISADGQFVAFTSFSSNLTADPDPGPSQIFLRDTLGNNTTLVSIDNNTPANPGNGISSTPSITADGGSVAFVSSATNLVAVPPTALSDIYVRAIP